MLLSICKETEKHNYIITYMTCTEEATKMAAKYLHNKKTCFYFSFILENNGTLLQ